MENFEHKSVLLAESIQALNIDPSGTYVDATLGFAGHSLEIVKRLKSGRLVGIDQDIDAIEVSKARLKKYMDKVDIVHSNYENFEEVLDKLGIGQVDGILLDLGVSSYQLDQGSRGFSFKQDYPLDMRMDQNQALTARDVVNTYSQKRLADIIFKYGEDRWAKRIAEFIVDQRSIKPIETTFDLVQVVNKAIPKKAQDKNPAIRTFQAIRIEVNRELEVLEKSIEAMVARLKPGGRLAIISFHSLEDRIVKNSFRYLASDCLCDPAAPICTCDKEAQIKIISKKPISPSQLELENNTRSRSAKLRISEKL